MLQIQLIETQVCFLSLLTGLSLGALTSDAVKALGRRLLNKVAADEE